MQEYKKGVGGSGSHKCASDWSDRATSMIDSDAGQSAAVLCLAPSLAAEATSKGAFVLDGEDVPLCGRARNSLYNSLKRI